MQFFNCKKLTSRQLSLLGAWSFLFGSGAFTYDSIIRKPISIPYFSGCMLFNIGCSFYILAAYRS